MSISHWLTGILGLDADSHTISAGHMAARAVVVFFATLILLRVSGQRTFGSNTSFDMVVKILLGAVLSRAVVAASPFGATLLASLVLVLLHRLLAWATAHLDWLGQLVKGQPLVLAENGHLLPENLNKADITEKDILEGLRDNANLATLDQAQTVTLERNGRISIVKKA